MASCCSYLQIKTLNKMRKLFALLFVPAAFLLASCGEDDTSDMQNPSLVQAATDAGLTTLLDAVTAVDGLADELSAATAITGFRS